MRGDLRVVADVADAFCDAVADAWATRDTRRPFTIALSGGDTARRCYRRLAERAGDPVDWSEVVVLWGDERCVPLDDPDSNHRLAEEALLGAVGPVATHPMRCDDADGYDRLVRDLAPIDLVHLGLGPDAHTASLFPGSPALDAPADRFVVGNEDPLGTNPHPRLTLTFAGIAAARRVVVTVEGPSKREALGRVRAGEDVPAARADAPGVLWLVDSEAAAS